MKFAFYFLILALLLSLCYSEEKFFINPNDFHEKILETKTNKELVDLAKKHDLNVTFVYASSFVEEERDVIQVFVNNGQSEGKTVLDLTKSSKEDLEKLIQKARTNGMTAYISREKYNDEGVLIGGYQFHDNQEFKFDLSDGAGIIKIKNDDFDPEIVKELIDHNIRVYNHTYTKNGEIDKTLQYDIVHPKIQILSETKYDHPDTLITAKAMLKSILSRSPSIELDSRAEVLRKMLDSGIKEYVWEVIINPKVFYSYYEVKIGLKVDDDEYYCLGRLRRKTDDSKQ